MAQAAMVHATLGKPGSTEPSLHIWEQPLPQEPATLVQPEPGTYQNQGSLVTMPCRGTLAGNTGTGCSRDNESQSQSGTWGGSKALYDPENGWQSVVQ